MELVGEDGRVASLEHGCHIEFGRAQDFAAEDPTVSRRHVLLQVDPENAQLAVQVVGANPIFTVRNGDKSLVRKGKTVHLRHGDSFSLSLKQPILFTVKETRMEKETLEAATGETDGTENGPIIVEREMHGKNSSLGAEKEEIERNEDGHRNLEENIGQCKDRGNLQPKQKRNSRLELELDDDVELQEQKVEYGKSLLRDFGLDLALVSSIDTVSEFGFLVMGREFEQYGKRGRGRLDLSGWKTDSNPVEYSGSDDDSLSIRKRKSMSRKGKMKPGEEDEEWTGESEEEKQQMSSLKPSSISRKAKDQSRPSRRPRRSKSVTSAVSSSGHDLKKSDDFDENDETLGGFIVDDAETLGENEETEEEEEQEWTEDEDDD